MKINNIKNILLGAFLFGLFTFPISEKKVVENTKKFYETEIRKSFESLNQIKYLNDKEDIHINSRDYWQTPEETDSLKTGDCEDKSIYFMDLLNKKGIETKLVYGALGNPKDRNKHIWLEYKIGDKDYVIECSQKGIIYEKDTLPDKNGYTFTPLYDKVYMNHAKNMIRKFNKRSNMDINLRNFNKYKRE